jgi:uncharacterized protein (TIGR03118 family)
MLPGMKHLIQSSLPEYTGETIVRPARFGSVISASFGTSTHLIFLNLNGTISVWNGGAGTTAQVQATTPGAVYTGLAIAGNLLYAANGAQNRIDVFNGSFAPTNLGAGAFVDPKLPAGLVPFNVQNINGNIYVTYARGQPR